MNDKQLAALRQQLHYWVSVAATIMGACSAVLTVVAGALAPAGLLVAALHVGTAAAVTGATATGLHRLAYWAAAKWPCPREPWSAAQRAAAGLAPVPTPPREDGDVKP